MLLPAENLMLLCGFRDELPSDRRQRERMPIAGISQNKKTCYRFIGWPENVAWGRVLEYHLRARIPPNRKGAAHDEKQRTRLADRKSGPSIRGCLSSGHRSSSPIEYRNRDLARWRDRRTVSRGSDHRVGIEPCQTAFGVASGLNLMCRP